jgi:hypothetical protein
MLLLRYTVASEQRVAPLKSRILGIGSSAGLIKEILPAAVVMNSLIEAYNNRIL